MTARRVVLIDTNVILECHKRGFWRPLAGGYDLETVEKCIEETQTGKQRRRPEHQIEEAELRSSFSQIHTVSQREMAEVAVRGGNNLDAGERELWAHAITRKDAWILCGPDKASVRFGYEAGFRERLISLEELFADIGFRPPAPLKENFEREWLDGFVRKLILGVF
ncbi:hypothetical protein [Caulobacter sp. NIBR1757]|uniref:hypothetical protein n=1 Tax=Caulobacter sp. NIBR1757 TaxID=3016000 RepID=UPI0022EFDC72|nr:hypothetical protein [Caulobacter sp. NIBR1757]